MIIYANLGSEKLRIGDGVFNISCNVRSISNGRRQSYEVIKTTSSNPEYNNHPYDPAPFPKGKWKITGLLWQADKKFDFNTYGPVKILTDATQLVRVWELDEFGDYLRETNKMVSDSCYWIHYSHSTTTLGCIRTASEKDIFIIARIIQEVFAEGEEVWIEVG